MLLSTRLLLVATQFGLFAGGSWSSFWPTLWLSLLSYMLKDPEAAFILVALLDYAFPVYLVLGSNQYSL